MAPSRLRILSMTLVIDSGICSRRRVCPVGAVSKTIMSYSIVLTSLGNAGVVQGEMGSMSGEHKHMAAGKDIERQRESRQKQKRHHWRRIMKDRGRKRYRKERERKRKTSAIKSTRERKSKEIRG